MAIYSITDLAKRGNSLTRITFECEIGSKRSYHCPIAVLPSNFTYIRSLTSQECGIHKLSFNLINHKGIELGHYMIVLSKILGRTLKEGHLR